MRVTNEVPVEIFVTHALRSRGVEKAIEGWHVDREVIAKLLVKHLHEMGLFTVLPYGFADNLLLAIPEILRSSPEIIALVTRAHRSAMARQANRRSTTPD